MKYIDKDLSPENQALLSTWIERRESRECYPDARRPEDREWWHLQQAMIRFQKEPPKLKMRNFAQEQMQYLNAYNMQAAQNSNYYASLQSFLPF